MEFEVNGIKYKPIEKQPKKQMSSSMTKVMMIAAMFGGLDGSFSTKKRNRPNVNIINEFELIEQKKSKLSRNDRDWVVFQFKKMYERV